MLAACERSDLDIVIELIISGAEAQKADKVSSLILFNEPQFNGNLIQLRWEDFLYWLHVTLRKPT